MLSAIRACILIFTKFQTPNTVGNCDFTRSRKGSIMMRHKNKKSIIYAAERGNRAVGRKFTISEANVRLWRNGRASIFSRKETTKSFT
jgi:hypothetical protein